MGLFVRFSSFLLVFFVLFFSACMFDAGLVDEDYFVVNLNLGFMPNIDPLFNASLFEPGPGSYGFFSNESLSLAAFGCDNFEFMYWEFKPRLDDSFIVYDKNYSFVVNRSFTINAFFGCVRDDACAEGFSCVDGACLGVN